MGTRWDEGRGACQDRGGWRSGVRRRVDDDDTWEDADSSWWRRWREEHARDRSDEHPAGIRRNDDRIGFNKHGWGFCGSEVELVRDHIAYDLAHRGGIWF